MNAIHSERGLIYQNYHKATLIGEISQVSRGCKEKQVNEGSYSSSGRWKRRKTLMKKTVKSIKFNTKFCFTCTFSKKQDQPKLFSFFIFDTNVFINDLSLKTEHKAKKEKKKKTQKRKKSGTNSNCIRVS
jgi:hypothetical protein